MLRLGALGALALACGARQAPPPATVEEDPTPRAAFLPLDATPPPEVTAVARSAMPAGRWERMLLPGTKWATPLVIRHSGEPGPVVFVLGGVHGDEPGAWAAAD